LIQAASFQVGGSDWVFNVFWVLVSVFGLHFLIFKVRHPIKKSVTSIIMVDIEELTLTINLIKLITKAGWWFLSGLPQGVEVEDPALVAFKLD
jgi:hypothetical protein